MVAPRKPPPPMPLPRWHVPSDALPPPLACAFDARARCAGAMRGRDARALTYERPLVALRGCEVRCHGRVLIESNGEAEGGASCGARRGRRVADRHVAVARDARHGAAHIIEERVAASRCSSQHDVFNLRAIVKRNIECDLAVAAVRRGGGEGGDGIGRSRRERVGRRHKRRADGRLTGVEKRHRHLRLASTLCGGSRRRAACTSTVEIV